MKNQTNQSEICQYCNLSDCECSDQEDWDSCDSPKPKTLYSFKEINLQNKSLLAEIRIICKNLIYVIGLAPNIAKEDQLKKLEYFGQYGQIQKLIVIQSNTFNPPLMLLILLIEMNKKHLQQSQQVKASFGTTKYCTNFLKGQQCKIKDCVYLHQHPKDKDSTQVLKRRNEQLKVVIFIFIKTSSSQLQKVLHQNQLQNALQKSVFPTTQNILDNMLKERVVEPIQQQQQQINVQWEEIKETQQQQEFPQPIQQKSIDIEKELKRSFSKWMERAIETRDSNLQIVKMSHKIMRQYNKQNNIYKND